MLWQTIHQLKSKDPLVRRRAVGQLCNAPNERAARRLATVLEDSDVEVRRLGALALGKIEDDLRVQPLLKALGDPDAGVVQAAAASLKSVPCEQVIPAVEPLLKHPDAAVRGQAAQTLDAAGWRPADRDQEIWYRVAKGQMFQAAGFGSEAVPALEAALASGSSRMGVNAVEALGHIGDNRANRALLGALRSPEPAICMAAVCALTRAGATEAISPIFSLLKSHNPQVRCIAVEGLGLLQAIDSIQAICALLKDPAWEVRRQAAEVLGRFRDGRAVEGLSGALSDSDADVREAAAISLGSVRDPRAVGPLVLALRDPSSSVRRIAAATLSRIDADWSSLPEARAAAEELKPALHDRDPGVRHFVGHLLAAISGTRIAPTPTNASKDLQPEQRQRMAVNCFVQLLTDRDRDLRQAAVEALGRLRVENSRPALARALADADAGVSRAAQEALQNFSGSPI